MNRTTLLKAWSLLDGKERRNACFVLLIAMIAAMSSAVMVGSIMPFLTVLTDPHKIQTIEIFSYVYDRFDFTNEYDFLVMLGLASLTIIVGANLLLILRSWAVSRFALMRIHTLSYRLLQNYLAQKYEFFLYKHTDELSTQILAESQEVVITFFRPLTDLVGSILTVLCILALIIWINPVVSLTVFSVIGTLYALVALVSRRLISRTGNTRLNVNKTRYRVVGEALGALKEIKLLGREKNYISRYCTPSIQLAQSMTRITIIGEVPRYVFQIIGFGGIILLCLLLIEPSSFVPGSTPGDLFPLLGVYAFAGQRLLPEFSVLYGGFVKLNYATPAVNAIYEDLISSKVADPDSQQGAQEAIGLKNELRLEHIHYRYPQAEQDGLKDISFSVQAGEKIGIVGTTGAGKTTLADLLLGLLSPTQGQLVVDDTPITESNVRAWQKRLGYVPQSIFLIDANVSENIAIGLPADEIDQARVETAARIANIDGFVRHELPHGYNTQIGENGVRLSGGQRQRIGIARALYEYTDLIIFDEATSALDNLTERDVIQALEALPENKTIFIIAHRLSTVKKCDKIVVLENGKLTGFAPWKDLAQEHPFFHQLVQLDEE